MASDNDAQAARDEFEVAWYTKELGRPLQRKLLQRRFDEIGDGKNVAAAAADAAHEPGPPPGERERPA